MLDLYVVIGGVVVAVSVVMLALWISKRLGAAEAQKLERERNLEKQRKLSHALARRDRTRGELVDWMRDQAND